MTFLQVRDILDQASAFHHHLQRRIASLDTDDRRLSLLASQIARREARLSAVLADSTSSNAARLNRWMKSVPEVDLCTPLERAFSAPIRDPDTLVSALLEAGSGLLQLLEALATTAPTPDLQQLFTQLAEREREGDRVHQRERLSVRDL